MATLVFSGKVYEGNVIKVVNGRIIVDGVDQGAVPISKEEPIKFSETAMAAFNSVITKTIHG